MDPVAPLAALADVLGRLGPGPALLAGIIVAMTLSVILLARYGNLWGAMRAGRSAETLQETLIAMVAANRATEEALRRRLDEAERAKAVTREELDETRAQLALLRQQRRRLITMMREVLTRLPEPAIRSRGSVT